jgi:hypothetical protein
VIDNTSHARAFGQPRWGAEAQSGTWPGATQYAVYGYPTTPTPLVAGSPANINTNEVPANAFELGTIPDASTKAGIRVGVCVQTDPSTGVANRIIHNGSEILDKDYLTQLCSTIINGYTAMGPAASTWYASAVNRAATFFAPKNLYADDDCAFCIGGLPSGWSPFSANAITAANISLAYVGPAPHNVNIGQVQTVVVSASTGTPSTPVPGVSVSISITGNSGQPGGATFGDSSTTITGTTLANGTVTFTFSVNKAGGYSLTTAGTLDTFPLGNTLVTFINVKNQ